MRFANTADVVIQSYMLVERIADFLSQVEQQGITDSNRYRRMLTNSANDLEQLVSPERERFEDLRVSFVQLRFALAAGDWPEAHRTLLRARRILDREYPTYLKSHDFLLTTGEAIRDYVFSFRLTESPVTESQTLNAMRFLAANVTRDGLIELAAVDLALEQNDRERASRSKARSVLAQQIADLLWQGRWFEAQRLLPIELTSLDLEKG